MREIKFRAWLIVSGRMLEDVGFDGSSSKANEVVEYMQYTGLKDKNGVEIYEGDVLSYQYPQRQLEKHKQLCTVIYEPKAAAFLLQPRHFEPALKYLGDIVQSNKKYDTRTYELCEVIGNIYENPELLEPK